MFTTQGVSCKEKKEKIRKQQDNFKNHHKAQQLRPLQTGKYVYIPDNPSNGTVIVKPFTCSYNVQTSDRIYRQKKTSVTITRTEDVAPTENVIPETLPLNDCCTKSVRISKSPERLKLVSRWSSKFDYIITAIVIACMHSYVSYYCLTCNCMLTILGHCMAKCTLSLLMPIPSGWMCTLLVAAQP